MKHLLDLGSRRYTTKLKMITRLPGIPAAVVLLDILFLTVLFFAQTSKYTRLSGFKVEVPRVKTAFTENIPLLHQYVISVMPSEKPGKPYELFFMNRPVDFADLPAELQSLKNLQKQLIRQTKGAAKLDVTVLVMIDRSIAFEHIAPVLATVGNAGLKCYLPVVQPKEQKDQSFER